MADKVLKDKQCDYCKKAAKFIGGVKATGQIFKACPLHKAKAEAELTAILKKRGKKNAT